MVNLGSNAVANTLPAGGALAAVACRLARRPVPPDVAGWLPGFRGRPAP